MLEEHSYMMKYVGYMLEENDYLKVEPQHLPVENDYKWPLRLPRMSTGVFLDEYF